MSAILKRIAVFRTCALGDAVQCTPLLRQIRADAPQARITFFTSENVVPLFAGAPFVDEVVGLKASWLTIKAGRRGMLRAWWEMARQGAFDAMISLEPTWLRNIGCLLVRAPVKAGLSFTGRKKPFEIFTHPLRITGDSRETTQHASEQYLQLWLQISGGQDRGLGYDMSHLLAGDGAQQLPERPFIALAPGTGNPFLKVKTKRWPPASFVELGGALLARGWAVVYLGGNDDLGGMAPPAGAVNLLGKTSVQEVAVLLSRAAAMCGNDSGLFHLAQGLQCPAVGIFGSSSPRFTGVFRAARAEALQAPLPCAGCYLQECAPPEEVLAQGLARPCCMSAVTPSQVVRRVEHMARFPSPSPAVP